MTDLEITKLCAEAMGIELRAAEGGEAKEWAIQATDSSIYDPLHDDAQAMALVKKFQLDIVAPAGRKYTAWWAHQVIGFNFRGEPIVSYGGNHENLNRAICETVAKMGKAKP